MLVSSLEIDTFLKDFREAVFVFLSGLTCSIRKQTAVLTLSYYLCLLDDSG